MNEWDHMINLCCPGESKLDKCDFYNQANTDDCAEACAEASNPVWIANLNVYNIYTGRNFYYCFFYYREFGKITQG